MNQRDRLIDLLDNAFVKCDDNYGMPNSSQVADYLLDNGVIAPPCNVGDTVYQIDECHFCNTDGCYNCPTYEELEETECKYHLVDISVRETSFRISMLDQIGETVFLTREEAEKVLEEMKK